MMKKIFILPFLLFVFLISFSSVNAQVTFDINSTVDATDISPGDGICETVLGSGECTLRAAIQETNALVGADTINLPAGTYNLTIAGQNENLSRTGDLDIGESLTIVGAGDDVTIIDGNSLDRVLAITRIPGGDHVGIVELRGLTITGGFIEANGAGIFKENATLKIIESTVTNNQAGRYAYGWIYGGGIHSYGGDLIIIDSTISSNQAHARVAQGAGIYAFYTDLTMENSTVDDNWNWSQANVNGAGVLINGNFSINNSTFSNNRIPGGRGGGLYQWPSPIYEGTVSNSVFNNNYSHIGGAIYSVANLNITNTTFSNNYSSWSSGSDIYLSSQSNQNYPQLSIVNSTFFGSTNSIRVQSVGSPYNPLSIRNSILSDRPNTDVAFDICGFDPLNHNLFPDNVGCEMTQGDLLLGALLDNGGLTWTRALLQGSPAIEAADPAYCPATDQRGVLRTEAICDIGAYEAEPLNQPPTAFAGPDQAVAEGEEVIFDGSTSTDPDGVTDIISYQWDFGDGNTSSGVSATHSYADSGIYTATLTVTDAVGEFDSNTLIVTVLTPSQAIQEVADDVQDTINTYPNTPLSDKLEDALAKLNTAIYELNIGNGQIAAGLGGLEGAVGDIQAAVDSGYLDQAIGKQLVDEIASIAKQLATDAIDQAIAASGDPVVIADAQQYLADADTYRQQYIYKDAVAKYKDALSKAESVF